MNQHLEAHEQSQYRYRFGSAEFDDASFELRVAGLRVEVERRALEVLACLLRHAGEVVTKEELFAEVWAGRVTVDKVLPNAITKLRRALGEANAEQLVTLPRIGYRLDGVSERIVIGRHLTSRMALQEGQPMPGRDNFLLQRQLGAGANEVWLAEHIRTHERRVYKLAGDDERLRALKREATLARVLQESIEQPTHFVTLIDWNFAKPPFFLECSYGGDALSTWAQTGLPTADTGRRLELLLQVIDAVASAHAVGVLHKDLKPANVLVETRDGIEHVRLTDFGSGRLLEPERLEELGITRFGLGPQQDATRDDSSGTAIYLAPEVFTGHAPTMQSDVYALGVMLYQMLAGDLNKPIAPGWDADIADPLLREDIRLATDGNPAHRLDSASALATRLRNLDARREAAQLQVVAEKRQQHDAAALARSQARRPYLIALLIALIVGVGIVSLLYRDAVQARNAARAELERATAINRFLNEDLVGGSNPLVAAKGQAASLKDVLIGARDRVGPRFATQPRTEATLRTNLAMLFNMIELLPEAEAEARRALDLHVQEDGADALESLKARALLARLLTRTSKLDEAGRELQTLEQLTAASSDPYLRYLTASVRGIYHMNQGAFADALPHYREAVDLLALSEPDNKVMRDSLRMDLIGALTQTGHLTEARTLGENLIAEIGTRSDDNGLVAAFAKAAVARIHTLEGDPEAAQVQLLDAQRTIVRLLGAEHTRNLMVESDLFDVAIQRADWPTALTHARHVHEGFRAKFGDDHNFSRLTQVNLGQALYENGDAVGAERELTPAYTFLNERFSAENPQTQIAGFWLAATKLELGHSHEVLAILGKLDADTLESAASNGAWRHRLDILRGLAMEPGEESAIVLTAALGGLKDHATSRSLFHQRAMARLSNAVPER